MQSFKCYKKEFELLFYSCFTILRNITLSEEPVTEIRTMSQPPGSAPVQLLIFIAYDSRDLLYFPSKLFFLLQHFRLLWFTKYFLKRMSFIFVLNPLYSSFLNYHFGFLNFVEYVHLEIVILCIDIDYKTYLKR